MNIRNTQITQGLFRIVEERFNAGKENVSSSEDASTMQENVPGETVKNSKVSGEEDLLQVVYPPFFPIGNTQDILLIEGVKKITGEGEKSGASVRLAEQNTINQKESNNEIKNADTSQVRKDIDKNKDAPVKGNMAQAEQGVNSGFVLDLKI
ncbi:MAG: hypothetical protein ABFD75_04475 [Smithella sp.]